MSLAVRQTLTTLVQRLAATPGVTALVLRETVSSGCDRAAGSRYGAQGDPLGYTPLLRLAFLRKNHVDPLDLEPETYEGQMTANLSLPEFKDWQALGRVAEDWLFSAPVYICALTIEQIVTLPTGIEAIFTLTLTTRPFRQRMQVFVSSR